VAACPGGRSTRRSRRRAARPGWIRYWICTACGTYITHLIEFGYPERFAQDQAGHSYASTTAIYTGVSDEFRNRLMAKTLRERYADPLGEKP